MLNKETDGNRIDLMTMRARVHLIHTVAFLNQFVAVRFLSFAFHALYRIKGKSILHFAIRVCTHA